MKKFTIFIVGFSFCLILVLLSGEYFLRTIPNDFSTKMKLFQQQKDKIEVLILGSSHAYVGVNPAYFISPTFNFANSSQTLDLDEQLFKKIKDDLPQLKTVIIPISYFSYVLALEDGKSAAKIKNYNIYYGIYSHTYELKNQFEILNQYPKVNWKRYQKYLAYPFAEVFTDANGFKSKGIGKKALSPAEALNNTLTNHTRNISDPLIQLRIDQNYHSLQQIIDWCQEKNINVVLLTTPVQASYLKGLDPIQKQDFLQKTETIVAKNNHLRWFNYLDLGHIFTSQDFKDVDHLSIDGAKKLSIMVNKELLKFSK